MFDFSRFESLSQKAELSSLEKDILDTFNELYKSPFDRNSAERQIIQNNEKHPEIFFAISELPTTEFRSFSNSTNEDIRSNLGMQLELLAAKAALKS